MPDDGAPFRYSFSALKDRHNAVEVNWIDPDNGWETATELVEDTQAIARYGRNVTKMDAFGCTSRGQAHRAGLWSAHTDCLIESEKQGVLRSRLIRPLRLEAQDTALSRR